MPHHLAHGENFTTAESNVFAGHHILMLVVVSRIAAAVIVVVVMTGMMRMAVVVGIGLAILVSCC